MVESDKIGRLLFPLIAGAALLVPLIITTFKRSQTARLVTVSVAVMLFGVTLALSIRATCQEVVAATAAYAAPGDGGVRWFCKSVGHEGPNPNICCDISTTLEVEKHIHIQCVHSMCTLLSSIWFDLIRLGMQARL